ncbi:hypothetical protein EB796_018087 [Bugula neritina]|uniref:Profilin n=1 Tax=Bugula neritina TaxID=10212 RepID=A0A7J7JCE9_BUGNE|nr:hypothetical protein EB796_018087 [Bugula neritina]
MVWCRFDSLTKTWQSAHLFYCYYNCKLTLSATFYFTMSWDPYIDNIIQQCPSVTKGTIIGLNGSIWTPATAANPKILAITQQEATTLAAVMCKKTCEAVAAALPAAGITVEGTRYMFLRDMDGDGRIVTAKKSGVGNLIAQSTTQGQS